MTLRPNRRPSDLAARALAGACLCLGLGPAAWAEADHGVSHRAVYDLTLGEAREGSNIAFVEGRMAYTFDVTCEGTVTLQRFVTHMVPNDGSAFLSDVQVETFETLDGSRFDFKIETSYDTRLAERVVGEADRTEGSIEYTAPKRGEKTLPKGVMFPSAFSSALIDAAVAGERSVSASVFDGDENGEAYKAFAHILPLKGTQRLDDSVEGDVDMDGQRAWLMSIAYYKESAVDAPPEYQVDLRLFENGISDRVLMDYGEFSLKAELVALEALEPAECP